MSVAPEQTLLPATLPADAIELGRVQEAWGIKGWVRILPHSADTEALLAASRWFLQPPEARFARGFDAFTGCVQVGLAEARHHADGIVARIDGVVDRNLAEALKGARIYLPRSDFPPTPEGEYYWVDLIGLDVVNRQGEHLGVVRDLLSTGPTSVLVLAHTEAQTLDPGGESPQGKSGGQAAERMIPFVSAYVDEVDQASRCIRVDWQTDYF
ncbi:MAG TPA: ribosome maturation factor RimM [Hydrogenophaga sp.]|uniref:ribosome maturation factor RimM n=1 Tax=Hydrogenophaga sp. TaxID=1904254 RepID=UPI002B9E7A85|nr:ribosome maturation factor RimM [Hydrogenophaga sp.]HMN93105.1 ribosome maturation factor RimM [Hydrogenophaga sp.]HMP10937.1 ribosome maturation factor RimM [Hydrogenophaga sp.]